MKLLLPRSRPRSLPISVHYGLYTIRQLAAAEHGILPIDRLPPAIGSETLTSLASSGLILLTDSHLADCSRIRAEHKKETDRNRLRSRSGSGLSPTRPFTDRLLRLFPAIAPPRQAVARPATYNIPAAFKPLIEDPERKSCHRTKRPPDVEEFAGPYYPGDLHGYLQVETEQTAAHREVWLLYTRKAAFLGIKRRVHMPL